eukprot:1192341-Prorocentrum_minimum.AAC.3
MCRLWSHSVTFGRVDFNHIRSHPASRRRLQVEADATERLSALSLITFGHIRPPVVGYRRRRTRRSVTSGLPSSASGGGGRDGAVECSSGVQGDGAEGGGAQGRGPQRGAQEKQRGAQETNRRAGESEDHHPVRGRFSPSLF